LVWLPPTIIVTAHYYKIKLITESVVVVVLETNMVTVEYLVKEIILTLAQLVIEDSH
jgi:hypothetical protein